MKKLATLIAMASLATFIATPVHASPKHPHYPVPKSIGVPAGIYQDGRLVIAAKQKNETQPIKTVIDVKSSVFFTEYHKGAIDYSCQRFDLFYQLKIKQGKSSVKTMKDQVSGHMSDLGTDGNHVYYVAAENAYSGDLVRLTADGKSRRVLVKDVEDFWYTNGQPYYVKGGTAYVLNLKTLKSQALVLGKGKLKPESACNGSTYEPGTNGLIFREKTAAKSSTYMIYDYKTKSNYKFQLKRFTSYDPYYNPVTLLDFNPRRAEFVENLDRLVLVDAESKQLKTLHTPRLKSEGVTTAKPYEHIDAVKQELVYVEGVNRIVKRFYGN